MVQDSDIVTVMLNLYWSQQDAVRDSRHHLRCCHLANSAKRFLTSKGCYHLANRMKHASYLWFWPSQSIMWKRRYPHKLMKPEVHNILPSEEDQAMATGNVQKIFW